MEALGNSHSFYAGGTLSFETVEPSVRYASRGADALSAGAEVAENRRARRR
jgi:hypothetical protein